jgi:hypothetical protein
VVESRDQGAGLAEVFAQAQDLEPRVSGEKGFQPYLRFVGAAVVDEKDFRFQGQIPEHGIDFFDQGSHVFGFVENGDDDRAIHFAFNRVK